MRTVDIVTGLRMPFYPVRPAEGRSLRVLSQVEALFREFGDFWVPQPKLNGDRACLGKVAGHIYVQNRHGSAYQHSVNKSVYASLPDRTCIDGEVYQGQFYPFELLALAGNSYLYDTTIVRVNMAQDICRALNVPWLFAQPSQTWLRQRRANLPKWEGVVLKRATAPYVIAGSPTQVSLFWLKRKW